MRCPECHHEVTLQTDTPSGCAWCGRGAPRPDTIPVPVALVKRTITCLRLASIKIDLENGGCQQVDDLDDVGSALSALVHEETP